MATPRKPPSAHVPLAPGEPQFLERTPRGPRFAKGHRRHGGRKPGVPNHLTRDAQELMRELVQYGLEHAQGWLERTAKKSPAKALLALTRAAEYVIPKKRSTELSGPGGGPVVVELVTLEGAPPRPPAQEAAVAEPPDEEDEE